MCFELCNWCRAWMHDTMMHLFWCSCSGSQAWVEWRRKNDSFDSDSDHLDWLAGTSLVHTHFVLMEPCKHTVTTNMQCCQYRSITKQEPQSPGEIRQGQKGAEILSLLRDHNLHINHKNWSNLFVSISSLIGLRPMVSGPRAGAGIMRASHTLTLTCDHQTRIHGAQGPGQWTRPNFHPQHRFEFQIC